MLSISQSQGSITSDDSCAAQGRLPNLWYPPCFPHEIPVRHVTTEADGKMRLCGLARAPAHRGVRFASHFGIRNGAHGRLDLHLNVTFDARFG